MMQLCYNRGTADVAKQAATYIRVKVTALADPHSSTSGPRAGNYRHVITRGEGDFRRHLRASAQRSAAAAATAAVAAIALQQRKIDNRIS